MARRRNGTFATCIDQYINRNFSIPYLYYKWLTLSTNVCNARQHDSLPPSSRWDRQRRQSRTPTSRRQTHRTRTGLIRRDRLIERLYQVLRDARREGIVGRAELFGSSGTKGFGEASLGNERLLDGFGEIEDDEDGGEGGFVLDDVGEDGFCGRDEAVLGNCDGVSVVL